MNHDASAVQRHSRHTSPLDQEVMSVDEYISSDDWLSEVRFREHGLAGPGIRSPYDYSLNLGGQSPQNYLQRADSLPMEGLSGASFPFGIAISPEDFDIPLPLYGSGHQGHPSTGLPVAYNSSPPLYPPNMEHPPSVDENAEWMAALETIPIHDPAGNTSTERPIRPEAIANEQSLPPEERFNDLVVVDDSLFTGRVEIPVLAPVLMSPVQNDPGLGDFIASLGGSLDNFSMETPERSQNSFPLLDMSPLSTRSAFGSNHLSSGSLVTEPIHTPLDFPQETTMAATPAFSNTPSSWDPFVTTREITTIHPYPCPPISYINTISPIYPPPNPSIPPTDGFPPPLYILPSSIPRPRHHQHRPRPVVCEKHFKPSPADAPFHALMNRARADLNFCEPSELKRDFCKRNKGPCPNQKRHPSPCFTIRVGRLSNQCRTETVAVREIRNVLGLCWTCKSCDKCLRDNGGLQKHKCEPTDQHPFTTNLTQDVIPTMPQ